VSGCVLRFGVRLCEVTCEASDSCELSCRRVTGAERLCLSTSKTVRRAWGSMARCMCIGSNVQGVTSYVQQCK